MKEGRLGNGKVEGNGSVNTERGPDKMLVTEANVGDI